MTWRYAETSVFKHETICDKRTRVEYNVKDICIGTGILVLGYWYWDIGTGILVLRYWMLHVALSLGLSMGVKERERERCSFYRLNYS